MYVGSGVCELTVSDGGDNRILTVATRWNQEKQRYSGNVSVLKCYSRSISWCVAEFLGLHEIVLLGIVYVIPLTIGYIFPALTLRIAWLSVAVIFFQASRCQVEMGTPQNGDPGSLLSRDNRDPGPHYTVIMGIPDAHYHSDYGDPFVKIGIPHQLCF